MSRWISIVVAMIAFAIAQSATSVALFGWSVVVGLIALIIAGVSFIAARVDSVSQGQGSREVGLLLTSGTVRGGNDASRGPRPAAPAPAAKPVIRELPVTRPSGRANFMLPPEGSDSKG